MTKRTRWRSAAVTTPPRLGACTKQCQRQVRRTAVPSQPVDGARQPRRESGDVEAQRVRTQINGLILRRQNPLARWPSRPRGARSHPSIAWTVPAAATAVQRHNTAHFIRAHRTREGHRPARGRRSAPNALLDDLGAAHVGVSSGCQVWALGLSRPDGGGYYPVRWSNPSDPRRSGRGLAQPLVIATCPAKLS